MVLGGVVFSSLLFVVYTLVRYFEAASPLTQALPNLRTSMEAKRVQLAEYEQRISDIRDAILQDEANHTRIKEWLRLLKQQNERLQALQVEKERIAFKEQIVKGEGDTR